MYNVGSRDELSNSEMAHKMLAAFNIDVSEAPHWIQHATDRPFNDMRYATDAQKLRRLGWEQKTSFDDGLGITIDWYRKFGCLWWRNVDNVLTAFPEVREGEVFDENDARKPRATPNLEIANDEAVGRNDLTETRKEGVNGGQWLTVPPVDSATNGTRAVRNGTTGLSTKPTTQKSASKKRGREPDGKENVGLDATTKRVMLGGADDNIVTGCIGNGETVR